MVFVSLLPPFAGLTVFWIICSIKRNVSKQTELRQEVLMHVLFLYILLVIGLTLSPFQINFTNPGKNINLIPFVESLKMWRGARLSTSLYNLVGNFLMLMPFGFLLPKIYPDWRKMRVIFFVSLGFSLLIECMQFATASRVFDIDDIILNTLGGVFGYMIFRLAHWIHPTKTPVKKRRPSMGAVVAGMMIFAVLMGLGAFYGLQGAMPSLALQSMMALCLCA